MNPTTKAKKLTAANCLPIRNARRTFNEAIGREFARLMNAAGEAAAREYAGRFFNEACRAVCVREIFGEN